MKKFLCLLFLMGQNVEFYAAPKSVYDSFWDKYDENNMSVIVHDDFDQFLKKYVNVKNGITYIDYDGVSQEDKNLLKIYVEKLENTPIRSYSRAEQQAYWINLYNALTVWIVLDNYPVESIRNIPNTLLKKGPWDKKMLTIEGKKVSLNDIEHRILRPLWKDARVHFLVNCASVGCPNIGVAAVTAQNYELMAEQAAKDFINHPRAVSVKGNELILTSLVDWYGVDFGRNIGQIIAYLNKYADNDTKEKLKNYKSNRIRYEYDWNLNEAENIP